MALTRGTVAGRALGPQGLLLEGLRILLGLSQHTPTLPVLLPQVLQLGTRPFCWDSTCPDQPALHTLAPGGWQAELRSKTPRL